jgi:outer membrane usher protein FimD/PapC
MSGKLVGKCMCVRGTNVVSISMILPLLTLTVWYVVSAMSVMEESSKYTTLSMSVMEESSKHTTLSMSVMEESSKHTTLSMSVMEESSKHIVSVVCFDDSSI